MEVCRVCGGTEILKCFQGNEQLTELLRVCANITITNDDILPKNICEQCEFGLRFSFKLRKQGEETEKRLRQEMQTQAISTTTDGQGAIVLEDVAMQAQSSALTRQGRLASDVYLNSFTSANEGGKDRRFAIEEQSPQTLIVGTHLRLDSTDQQVSTSTSEIVDNNQVAVLNEEDIQEISVADRLRLELRKRGVIMCTRPAADEKKLSTQQAIAGKRILLEFDSASVDDTGNYEEVHEQHNENSNNKVKETKYIDDVIELLDDEPMMAESVRESLNESEMNATAFQAEDMIEEIFSSDDEGARDGPVENANGEPKVLNHSDIVYEDFDDEFEESVGIDECQIHFTKEECVDFDCDEYVESVETQENETILDDDESEETCLLNEKEETANEVETGSTSKMYKGKILAYTCPTCNSMFDTHRELREHTKSHGGKRFLCKECNKWFPQLSRLQRHAKCHQSTEARLQCPLCERTYQMRSNLTRHIRNVHEKKGCICAVCGEIFGRSDVLKNHMAKHTDERNFQCEKCPERFKSKHYLDKHLHKHQQFDSDEASKDDDDESIPATKKSHYCHYCGKVSKHHFTHKMHMRIHTQERPHKCEACSKAFRTLAALITHERIHDDARPYQCEHCLLSFRQQGHLKEHRMIHEGITPHVCSICKLAFTKKNNMLVHMRIHSGENPYKCMTCGEQFKKSMQLRKHESTVHNKQTEDNEEGQLYQDENDDGRYDYEEEDRGEEQENAEYENDGRFADLASELLGSDSKSLEVIEEDNLPPISVMSDGMVIQGSLADDLPGVVTSIGLESAFSNTLSDDFHVDDTGVVLVMDDNAKFNSLFIMDD